MAIWPPLACGYTKKVVQCETGHFGSSNEPVYRVNRGTGGTVILSYNLYTGGGNLGLSVFTFSLYDSLSYVDFFNV